MLLVNDLFFEILHDGTKGISNRLSQTALGCPLHGLSQFHQLIQVFGVFLSAFDGFHSFQKLLTSHPAGSTLPAGFLGEEIQVIVQDVVHGAGRIEQLHGTAGRHAFKSNDGFEYDYGKSTDRV